MKSEDYISIKNLSEELGMDRSHARRYILKLGITPQKRRTLDSRNQLTLTITKDEADLIKRNRSEQGFNASEKIVDAENGYFYIIRLVPELDQKRIKLGYTNNLKDRLNQHRTAAPTAIIIKSWPCKRSWESTVMDSLSSVNCKIILNEVFECENIEKLIEHGNKLFELLPDPKKTIEISNYSPNKN
jgi:predicted GIY-YIG superfamily endonuclease